MFRELLVNEKGTAVILVALAAVLLVGCAGLALDGGMLYVEKQSVQNALDAASLAAAQELPNTTNARAKAIEYAGLNGLSSSDLGISFLNGNQRIQLTYTKNQNLLFMPVLGIYSTNIQNTAEAEAGSPGHAFDYSLFSGSTSDDLKINGNTYMIDGTVHTNSAFKVNGNTITVTGAAEAVKTITSNGNSISIPYRYPNSSFVEMPDHMNEVRSQAQAAGNVYSSDVHYNGNSINVNNSIYVDGDVHINGNTITGAGAILTTGSIHINGNCISATTQDQVCLYSGGDIDINGNGITVSGILYAPNGTININGNNITINGRVIADKIRINGNTISIDGDGISVISLPGSSPRLVL